MALNFYLIKQGITFKPKASAPSSPSNGAFYYDSTLNKFRAYENGSFQSVLTSATTQLSIADGTVALPAYSFSSDPDTGMYRIAANRLGFAVNAANSFEMNDSYNRAYLPIFVENGSAAAPSYSFTNSQDAGLYRASGSSISMAISGAQVMNWQAAELTSNTHMKITGQQELRLNNSGNTFYTAIRAQNPTANYTITLPSAAPGTNTFLKFDGTNYTWGTPVVGTGDLNQGGNAFGTTLTFGTTDAFPISFITNSVAKGSVSSAGQWVIGAAAGTQSHSINGSLDGSTATSAWGIGSTGAAANSSLLIYTAAGSTGDALITFRELAGAEWSIGRDDSDSSSFKFSQNTALGTNDRLSITTGGQLQTGLGSSSLPSYSFIGDPNTGMFSSGADVLDLVRGGQTALQMTTSGGNPYLITTGRMDVNQIMGIGSGSHSAIAVLNISGNTPSALSGDRQLGITVLHAVSSAATHASLAAVGVYSGITTQAAAFTAPVRIGFMSDNATKGAGSTITRDIGYLVIKPTQGDNNASISDNITFTGSYFINQTSQTPIFTSGIFTNQTGAHNSPVFTTDSGNFGVNLRLEVSTAATTADAILTFTNNAGASPWTMGRDASDSAKFKIAQRDGGFVGSNEFFTITLGGLVTIGDSPTNAVQHVINGRWLDIQTNSAGDAGLLITNNNTGSGANAEIEITAATSTSGDSKVRFNITGGDIWSHGVDNSDSDAYVISNSGVLGTSNVLRLQGTVANLSSVLRLPDGSNATPALSFTSQTGLGFWASAAGVVTLSSSDEVQLQIFNAGTNDNSLIQLTNNGSSSGDQYILMREGGVTADQWSMGRDDSDSGSWKVSQNSTLGTNDFLKVTTGGDVYVPAGTSSSLVGVGGTSSVNVNEVANSGTGETDLQSFTIAANTLTADGDALEFEWFGTTSGANTKTLRLYVDGTLQNTVVLPTSNSRFRARVYIHKSTTNVVKGYAEILSRDSTPTGNLLTEYIEEGITLSSSFVVKLTGQSNVGSNEIVSRGARADWKPSN